MEKFYVPSRAEAPPGTTFSPRAPYSTFVKGSDGRIYTTGNFGFNALNYSMGRDQLATWLQMSGITEEEYERAKGGAAMSWDSSQYDRDVARLHIEADRLGFRCVALEGPIVDKFRRMYDETGRPTGMVKHMRTGNIVSEASVPSEQIVIPESINAQSAFKTESVRTLPASDVTAEQIKRGSDPDTDGRKPAKVRAPRKKK
jgi:hypothetical protein